MKKMINIVVFNLVCLLAGCSALSQKTSSTTIDRKINGEEWECEEIIHEQSGTIDHSRCKDSEKKWACYQVVEKVCVEKNTQRKQSLKEKRFTGKCGALSDCW